MTDSDIAKFFFEVGQLSKVKRSGWWLIGDKNPSSVAEHSFRASAIGYVLGKLEGANADKVALMCIFQDMPEARVLDLHKLSQRYVDNKTADKKALDEQLLRLPKEIASEINHLYTQYANDSSKEGIIARDADLLENAVEAREMINLGFSDAKDWLNNIRGLLRTKSAKRLFNTIVKEDPNSWWKGLKKIAR